MESLSSGSIYDNVYPKKIRMTKREIRTLFWDFYALELLRHDYKKNEDVFEVRRIESMLGDMASKLLGEQILALEASVRGEIRYFLKACRNKQKEVHSSDGVDFVCKVSSFLADTYRKETPTSLSLNDIAELFKKTVWKDGSYGGSKWAKGTKLLIEAKEVISSGKLNEIVVMIDRIFDLQHNDGFMLNKTNFKTIDDYDDLNVRKDLSHLDEFLQQPISKKVREMIKQRLEN